MADRKTELSRMQSDLEKTKIKLLQRRKSGEPFDSKNKKETPLLALRAYLSSVPDGLTPEEFAILAIDASERIQKTFQEVENAMIDGR